jgi:hypothetical protein
MICIFSDGPVLDRLLRPISDALNCPTVPANGGTVRPPTEACVNL